jgi:hypothetical protein
LIFGIAAKTGLDDRRRTDEKRKLGGDGMALRPEWQGYRFNGKHDRQCMGHDGRGIGVNGDADRARTGAAGHLRIGVRVRGFKTRKCQNQKYAAQRYPALPAGANKHASLVHGLPALPDTRLGNEELSGNSLARLDP